VVELGFGRVVRVSISLLRMRSGFQALQQGDGQRPGRLLGGLRGCGRLVLGRGESRLQPTFNPIKSNLNPMIILFEIIFKILHDQIFFSYREISICSK